MVFLSICDLKSILHIHACFLVANSLQSKQLNNVFGQTHSAPTVRHVTFADVGSGSLRAEWHRREGRHEKFTCENHTLPTIHLGQAGRGWIIFFFHPPFCSHTHPCFYQPCQTHASNPKHTNKGNLEENWIGLKYFFPNIFRGHLIWYHLILTDNFNGPAGVLDVRDDLQKLI